ncbi:hypothetical protein AKJ09_01982 [Labilithrix luteola]|uniref:Lipoprotein n=1 Tax=Labilithrix luteola TaxID=1391654 RepID=A0A0K1PP72_9BACT|nr:hypothetical protein [Labilithrix luteola]AKU95318.1 hypothetical protein AKJ09_01982 [Labilithrix luteola]
MRQLRQYLTIAFRSLASLALFSIASSLSVAACGSSDRDGFGQGNDPGFDGDGGVEKELDRDPITCAEATKARTYVGCDYWATVTGNIVPDIFDFAVVVSNGGQTEANVKVTGPNDVAVEVKVAPGKLEKVFLPWVPALKGQGVIIANQAPPPLTSSVMARKSAYHVESSVPVVVYQFSPLEYAGKGGPSGKNWSSCPELGGPATGCFSYSNDASLLIRARHGLATTACSASTDGAA